MKSIIRYSLPALCVLVLVSCSKENSESGKSQEQPQNLGGGQSTVVDDVSQKDIVKVAVGSKDHTTLVAAIKAADLVNSLANAGPFTVFAPTNDAFSKLPAGTVDNLLKPENKEKLADILQHHVTVSVFTDDMLTDNKVLSMVDGNNVKVTVKDGSIFIDGAKIIGSVRASNGIVHVVDAVILPQAK